MHLKDFAILKDILIRIGMIINSNIIKSATIVNAEEYIHPIVVLLYIAEKANI